MKYALWGSLQWFVATVANYGVCPYLTDADLCIYNFGVDTLGGVVCFLFVCLFVVVVWGDFMPSVSIPDT